jgi:hypothetical protein
MHYFVNIMVAGGFEGVNTGVALPVEKLLSATPFAATCMDDIEKRFREAVK